ncbi:GerAB/ArcD/ProY family transporter [Lysinibacillus antri]|uniref:Uncharacterized protein n=1 Tax=Lysinibacillus antri TaxID=2498145 RepID=A0A432LCT9_9BACI|nr:GerAB/ArcD/ProY family transporter [Lysinibacillus antri]RUL54001.1 hypothetical protein EK386_07690 [Lysinibacillus antri]
MKISLSRIQFFMLLFPLFTGFVYISIQSIIIDSGKRAAWLIFIVASILVYLLFILYEKTYKYFILGKVSSVIYQIYWLFHLSLLVSYTIFVVSTWMSPNTPKYALLLMLLIPSLYASLSRAETAVNIGAIFGTFIIFFIIFILNAADDFEYRNLVPTSESGLKEWIWGLIYSFSAYRNMECYLILRKYVMKNEKIAGKPLFYFVFLLFFMYMFSIITVSLYFSLDEFRFISEPLLYILHTQEVTFIKRLDLIFVFFWVLITIITIINFILVVKLVHFKKKRKYTKMRIVLYHILIFIFAYYFANFADLQWIRVRYWITFPIFGVLLPIMIITWNKVRGRTIFDSSNSSS